MSDGGSGPQEKTPHTLMDKCVYGHTKRGGENPTVPPESSPVQLTQKPGGGGTVDCCQLSGPGCQLTGANTLRSLEEPTQHFLGPALHPRAQASPAPPALSVKTIRRSVLRTVRMTVHLCISSRSCQLCYPSHYTRAEITSVPPVTPSEDIP